MPRKTFGTKPTAILLNLLNLEPAIETELLKEYKE